MNEPDTATILSRDDDDRTTNDCGHTEETAVPTTRFRRPPLFVKCWLVTVEPVMFLTMFSVAMSIPLSTQYLWDRISEDVGYNGSKTSECNNVTGTPDPLHEVDWNVFCQLIVRVI